MSRHALHIHAKPCAERKRHTRARAVSVKPCARAVSVILCTCAVSVNPCAERKRHTRARAVSVNPCACAACLTADTPHQTAHQKDGQAACSRRLPVLGVCADTQKYLFGNCFVLQLSVSLQGVVSVNSFSVDYNKCSDLVVVGLACLQVFRIRVACVRCCEVRFCQKTGVLLRGSENLAARQHLRRPVQPKSV